jgi:hypothetical protein
MAYSANMNTSYELKNYEQLLGHLIERTKSEMNKPKGGAASLRTAIHQNVAQGVFVERHQVKKPEGQGIRIAIGELCQSYQFEVTQQLIDPHAVEQILFGPDGLVRKAGGGRSPYLMEDIEVAFIQDGFKKIGPVISSGRNRLLALQIILLAAGAQYEDIKDIKIRVSEIHVMDREELERRIISANTGSRAFSRAEIRERMGSSGGVVLTTRETIQSTIAGATNEKTFKAALGAWIKDAAIQSGLNQLKTAQYSDAGNSLWNQLSKANRPESKTFYSWIKADTGRFLQIAKTAEAALPSSVEAIVLAKEGGMLSTKLAKRLAPAVAGQCGLQV